jgi:hypothetical protein
MSYFANTYFTQSYYALGYFTIEVSAAAPGASFVFFAV